MVDTTQIKDFDKKIDFLKSTIVSIPNYPKEGILFRDITSLCENGEAFSQAISLLAQIYENEHIDKIVAAEARGFVFGAALASHLNCGMVLVRKPGKLPRQTVSESYELEYGFNELQIHSDSIKPDERVLLIDDLLATGGTVDAMCKLVTKLGGKIVDIAFIIELFDLGGAERIYEKWGIKPFSLIKFPGH